MNHFPPYIGIEEYRNKIRDLDIHPVENRLALLTLGLTAESGEVAGKIYKYYRDGGYFPYDATIKELGDLLWFTVRLIDELQTQVGEVAAINLNKLLDRKERGVLQGSGDNR